MAYNLGLFISVKSGFWLAIFRFLEEHVYTRWLWVASTTAMSHVISVVPSRFDTRALFPAKSATKYGPVWPLLGPISSSGLSKDIDTESERCSDKVKLVGILTREHEGLGELKGLCLFCFWASRCYWVMSLSENLVKSDSVHSSFSPLSGLIPKLNSSHDSSFRCKNQTENDTWQGAYIVRSHDWILNMNVL